MSPKAKQKKQLIALNEESFKPKKVGHFFPSIEEALKYKIFSSKMKKLFIHDNAPGMPLFREPLLQDIIADTLKNKGKVVITLSPRVSFKCSKFMQNVLHKKRAHLFCTESRNNSFYMIGARNNGKCIALIPANPYEKPFAQEKAVLLLCRGYEQKVSDLIENFDISLLQATPVTKHDFNQKLQIISNTPPTP